jgi:hypothetical protein
MISYIDNIVIIILFKTFKNNYYILKKAVTKLIK